MSGERERTIDELKGEIRGATTMDELRGVLGTANTRVAAAEAADGPSNPAIPTEPVIPVGQEAVVNEILEINATLEQLGVEPVTMDGIRVAKLARNEQTQGAANEIIGSTLGMLLDAARKRLAVVQAGGPRAVLSLAENGGDQDPSKRRAEMATKGLMNAAVASPEGPEMAAAKLLIDALGEKRKEYVADVESKRAEAEDARLKLEALQAEIDKFDSLRRGRVKVDDGPAEDELRATSQEIFLNRGVSLLVAGAVATKTVRLVSGDEPGALIGARAVSQTEEALREFIGSPGDLAMFRDHDDVEITGLVAIHNDDHPVSPVFGSYGQVFDHPTARNRFERLYAVPGAEERMYTALDRDEIIADHARPDSFGGDNPATSSGGDWIRPSHIPFLRTVMSVPSRHGEFVSDVSEYEATRTALIYAAQPVFVSAPMVDALINTDDPGDEMVASLHLPHQATLIVPGIQTRVTSDLPFDLPVSLEYDKIGSDTVDTWWIPCAPTFLACVVMFTNDDGTVADDAVIGTLTVVDPIKDPDTGELVSVSNSDHDLSGFVMAGTVYTSNWRGSILAPHIRSLVAAVAIREREGYDTPTEPFPTGQPRKYTRSSAFKKNVARGKYVKIRMIDLTPADRAHIDTDRPGDAGRSVTPHFRRGHFRRVRHGSRDDWWYVPTWVAPTFVRGKGEEQHIQVWKAS